MLEVSKRIRCIGFQESFSGAQVQPTLVQQPRDHRRAAAMHADDADDTRLYRFHDVFRAELAQRRSFPKSRYSLANYSLLTCGSNKTDYDYTDLTVRCRLTRIRNPTHRHMCGVACIADLAMPIDKNESAGAAGFLRQQGNRSIGR